MRKRNAFTLIELVVVILILGILAGVAAPKLFNTSAVATDNGLKQTLSIVRDAIELYKADNGALPPCTSTGADFRSALSTYIRGNFPTCPVGSAQNSDVAPATGTIQADASPTTGWKFFTDSGAFICNNPNATTSDALVTYDSL